MTMTMTGTGSAPRGDAFAPGPAARLIQELAGYNHRHAGQLSALCAAAADEGWSGPQSGTCLALTAAVTRTSALLWLLSEVTARYGPAAADDLAQRMSSHLAGEA